MHRGADAADPLGECPGVAGIAALEDQLDPPKHSRGRPSILHLATHGFYLEKNPWSARPLTLSGLALAHANDGLRGLALAETEANLRAIVSGARRAGARVLLLGMLLPPNYGPDYTEGFRRIFPRLADELGTGLVPFLLTDVAGIPELNQADGIHPTAEGHRLMAGNVVGPLREMLASDSSPSDSPPAAARTEDR